jgi:ribonuclease R
VEKQHSLVGENTGETFRIGDRIRVVVALVSLEKRQIDFNLADNRPAGKKRVVKEAAPDKGKIAKRENQLGKRQNLQRKTVLRNKKVTGAKRGRSGRKS